MRFDDIDGEVVEDPGKVEAIGRVLKNVGLGGFGEEAQAAMESVGRLGIVGFGDSPADLAQRWKSILSGGAGGLPKDSETQNLTYSQRRNAARAVDDVTHEAHQTLSNVVGFGVGLVHPINKLGGKGLAGAMNGGAIQGAVQGLGDSRADLTDGDIENYVRAFQDTSNGANYGAAFGAAGHGLGVAARGVGRRVGGIIDDARESLFREEAQRGMQELAEADAPRISQREAEAAAQAKMRAAEQKALDKASGAKTQVDRRLREEMRAQDRADRAAEREAQRASKRPRGPSEAVSQADPNETRVLRGYQGSAGERRAVNFDRVEAYRQRLADPTLDEAKRLRLQRYIESYGDAVDNPGDFERRHIERELRKNYPGDVVDRIMAERVGPDGSIRSRGAAPGLPPEPRTMPMGNEDWAAQGFTPDEVVGMLGHGGSAWKGYTPRSEMPTQAGRPDFSDYEVPYGSPMFRENLAREVEREGLDAPHWQRPREPGERPLTPYENAQLEVQNRRTAPDEDTVPQYGYPPEEEFRYRPGLPEDADFAMGEAGGVERPSPLSPLPARRPGGAGMFDVSDKVPAAVHEAPMRAGGGAAPASSEPFDLPPLEDMTEPGQPRFPSEPLDESTIPGFSPVGPRPEVRAAAADYGRFAEAPPAPAPAAPPREPTAAARPRAMASPTPEPAAPLPSSPDPTVAQRPSWMPPAPTPGAVPRYDTPEAKVYEYLQSLQQVDSPAMQRAQSREASAFGDLARKGGQAVLDADNPFSAAMRGPWAVTREAIRNPAVRARALSALRLRRLANVDPQTWSRVGRALEQALQQGPEEYAAAVHVYNQTDPGFREAQRKTEEGLKDMDDERLDQELRAAGLL